MPKREQNGGLPKFIPLHMANSASTASCGYTIVGFTTLNHVKFNFDILLRDTLPEGRDLQIDEHKER